MRSQLMVRSCCRTLLSPGCFELRAQLCVKSADSGPSPSRPGCLWNFELRCNVGRAAAVSMKPGLAFCPPAPLAHSLCSSLSVSSPCTTFFHCFIQSSAPHLLQHNIPFASVSSPLFLASSVSRPVCSFLPLPSHAPPSLPDCCIPALPGDRDCWLCLCLCRAAVLRAVHICSYSSLSQDMFAHFTLTWSA